MKTTRIAFISIFFTLLSISATAQNFITVSGRVVDKETGDPLVFASIGLKGYSIGTISNSIGEFDFHIPIEQSNSILEINMIGYLSFSVPVEELIKSNIIVFELQRSSSFLEEVIITDSLSGSDIFNIAIQKIDQNYPSEPYLLDGFYRDIKSVAGTYIGLLEAAVKIWDKDYVAPKQKMRLRERVSLVEVRKSLGYDNKFTSFFDQTNLLEDLLLHNNVKYRQFPEEASFYTHIIREEGSFYNGRRVFQLGLRNSDRLKIYIDAVTFAFIRLEYDLGPSDEVIDRKNGLTSTMHSLKKIIEFKEYAGAMYLSHIDLLSEVYWSDEKTGELKFTTELHQQLMVNKIHPRTQTKIDTDQKMKRFGLQYQHRTYNKEFWDNYNVIKETPLDRRIVTDLEKELSLEKQFLDN